MIAPKRASSPPLPTAILGEARAHFRYGLGLVPDSSTFLFRTTSSRRKRIRAHHGIALPVFSILVSVNIQASCMFSFQHRFKHLH